MKFFKKLFNNKQDQIDQIEKRVEEILYERKQAEARIKEEEERRIMELTEANLRAEDERKAKMEQSKIPTWIIQGELGSDGLVKWQLDWNTSWMEYLRRHDYLNPDEEYSMMQFLFFLSKQFLDQNIPTEIELTNVAKK